MKFTTKNKLKKEAEITEKLTDFFTFLVAASITEEALENLENHSGCLEDMVEKAEAEEFSIQEAIILGFVHGYKHGVVNYSEDEYD